MVIKIAGVTYLLWIAGDALRHGAALTLEAGRRSSLLLREGAAILVHMTGKPRPRPVAFINRGMRRALIAALLAISALATA